MNRRDFLRSVGLSAGGVALLGAGILVPERTFFLPPRGGWPLGDVRRYGAVGDGWQEWRWNSDVQERYRALFCSIQNAEWAPPDARLRDLYAYATEPREGPLMLDIIVGPG